MVRVFIAIPLPAEISAAIEEETAALRNLLKRPLVRWVPRENMHLTLKFLGNVDLDKIRPLKHALTKQLSQAQRFSVRYSGLGVFPHINRPRVIWAGVDQTKKLRALHQAVEAAASQIACVADRHPFSPHLTLARVNQRMSTPSNRAKIRRALEALPTADFGATQIAVVHLFQSALKSSGAVYTKLHSVYLKES